jgi:hypothetical protein
MRTGRVYSIAAALLLAQASSAVAQSWVVVHSDSSGTISIDASSIRRNGVTVHFWEQMQHTPAQRLNSGLQYDLSTSLVRANCDEMSYRLLQSAARMNNAVVIAPYVPSQPQQYAQPGTVIHTEIQRACDATAI